MTAPFIQSRNYCDKQNTGGVKRGRRDSSRFASRLACATVLILYAERMYCVVVCLFFSCKILPTLTFKFAELFAKMVDKVHPAQGARWMSPREIYARLFIRGNAAANYTCRSKFSQHEIHFIENGLDMGGGVSPPSRTQRHSTPIRIALVFPRSWGTFAMESFSYNNQSKVNEINYSRVLSTAYSKRIASRYASSRRKITKSQQLIQLRITYKTRSWLLQVKYLTCVIPTISPTIIQFFTK